jgi:7-cyano-7-deazaguanine synthase
MTDKRVPAAVVLLSGGLDSATCLALARAAGYRCYALSFAYGQRHEAELWAAKQVAHALGAHEFRQIALDLGGIGGSALTDHAIAVPDTPTEGIPVTYVPARNTVFLALALAWAEVLEADAIFIGVNAVDYSGYPDCRPQFIDAFAQLVQVATKRTVEGGEIRIEAPLLHLSKAQIIQRGQELQVPWHLTVSCYQADEMGRGCGRCDSCRLRREGFLAAGVADPTIYQC